MVTRGDAVAQRVKRILTRQRVWTAFAFSGHSRPIHVEMDRIYVLRLYSHLIRTLQYNNLLRFLIRDHFSATSSSVQLCLEIIS